MWPCRAQKKGESRDERIESKEGRLFLENGGRLLEELIISCDGKSNPIQIFSKKELERATNNYNEQQLSQEEALYKLFTGSFDDRTILIKKYFKDTQNVKWSINEVVVASQMNNHNNVLKLLGCCLETDIPSPVFEFVPNGDLSDHILVEEGNNPPRTHPLMPWELRLKIAIEVADAVTYLHTATPRPIIHRNIKPKNIFLDEHFIAKLSDFGLSISIPFGETHVNDEVRGTIGYIAPESITTGRFTEKSDVFSFGMILLELLTGQRTLEFSRLDHVRSIAEKNEVLEMVAPVILQEGIEPQQLQAFLKLAVRCSAEMEGERPAMIDVANALRRIQCYIYD